MSAATRRTALGAILAAPLASVPAVAVTERSDHLRLLLLAYEERRLASPFWGEVDGSSEDAAANLVMHRLNEICTAVLQLPPPQTLDGLRLAALAAAFWWEGEDPDYEQDKAVLALIRAVLGFTGTVMPAGWCGFGDEPECIERDRALYSGQGKLPAWALARAEAERCA